MKKLMIINCVILSNARNGPLRATNAAAGFDLSGRLRNLKAPLLVIHGRRDRTTPCSQGERIYAEAPGPKWMEIYEDGDHCCHNIPFKTHPLMADWASEMLRG